MRYILILLAIFTLFISNLAYAKILTIEKITDIWPELLQADKNTLILVDANDVLIVPLPDYNMDTVYRKSLIAKYQKALPEQKIDEMLSIILKNRKIKLVDNNIPEIYEYIKKHKIPATVITKGRTKNYGIIPNMTDFRINEIQTLGLDFKALSPFKKDMILPDMITDGVEKQVKTPVVKSGMIFTSRLNKAKVLDVVLKKYNFYPKKIIYIDDKMHNIKHIEDLAKKLNIDFIGYEFTAAKYLPTLETSHQEDDHCFLILQQKGVWCH